MDPNSFIGAGLIAVVSAAFGALAKAALPNRIRFGYNPAWKDIAGEWNAYYLITQDGRVGLPHHEQFHIVRNYLDSNSFKLTVTVSDKKEVQYSGTAEKEPDSAYWIVQMHPIGRREKIMFRITYPMAAKEPKLLFGLYSALDLDGIAAAGPAIFSQKELSDHDVRAKIKANFDVLPELVMRINRPEGALTIHHDKNTMT